MDPTSYITLGTTLYSFGGAGGGLIYYNHVHRLDLSESYLEWKEVVPRNPSAAPKRKSSCQMVSFQENKLLVFAGITGPGQWTDELHVFNLQEGELTSLSLKSVHLLIGLECYGLLLLTRVYYMKLLTSLLY